MAEQDPEQDGFLKRLRLPAAVLLALLLMVGAYYILAYQENYEYLASRNFRLLATLGKQVRDAVRNEGMVFSNVVGRPEEPAETARLDLEALSPRITEVLPCTVATKGLPPDQTTAEGKVNLWRMLGSSDGAYRLSFKLERPKNGVPPVCGEVELKDLLDPLFNSRQAFDAVLLANSAGKVVYLNGPKSLRVQQLDLLIENRHDAKVVPGKGEDKGFNAFQGYSGSAEVELGGRLYTTFVQPFNLPLTFVEAGPSEEAGKGSREVWLLAGLVSKDELSAKSLALSPSSVAFLLGILLLTALAWPLVKLRMLGERQRVKKTDVLLVGLCSLLGVSVATIFVLDLGAYRTLKSSSERQLKDFAEQMESNLLVEIRRAYDQLSELEKRKGAEPYLAEGYLRKAFYPHLESFALIDGMGPNVGQQVFKQTPWKGTLKNSTPKINVAERLYFQRIHRGPTLNVPEPEPENTRRGPEPFFLESVQSWTNGEWQAVIAKPSARRPEYPNAQVAALAIQMLSVINPVTPPGFEFAVVGDDGTVLFHSDSARNLAENFFEETDQDRRFKSIVSSRHDEPLDIRYWGDSYRAFAIPVKGLPWTIVAMRNEQVLERVNLDWLVTTLILVLLYTGALALALTAITLLRPGYRAGWVWPDLERGHDYAKLVAIFGIFCMAFLIALFGLRGTGFLFGVAALLPGLSLVAAYLKLNQAGHRTAKRAAIEACGVVLLALLWLVLGAAPLENAHGLWVTWTIRALVVCAFLLAADGPRRWRDLPAGDSLPMSRSYPMLGLLLVLLAAVLPTAGFFKVAHRLQVNSFVRNGQLKMAKDLRDRVDLLKTRVDAASAVSGLTVARGLIDQKRTTIGLREPGNEAGLDFYGAAFFNTKLTSKRCGKLEKEEFEPLTIVLPPYSDYTAENRELLHNQTSDDDWEWCESAEGDTVFDGENYLGVRLVSQIEPTWRGNGPLLAMAGLLPPWKPTDLVEETYRNPVAPGPKEAESFGLGQVARGLSACGVLILSGILLYALVTFVARRIFLLDVQEPLWTVAGTLAPIVGRNLFLVRESLMSEEDAAAMSLKYLHLGQIDDGSESGGEVWAKRCRELVDSGCNLVVAGFEHRISNPAFNARKLELLESLIELRERSIIVLSRVSPARLFASEPAHPSAVASGPPATYERWRTVLSSFTLIEEDLRPKPAVNGRTRSYWGELRKLLRLRRLVEETSEHLIIESPVLQEEGGRDPFLKQIAHGVESSQRGMGREQLLEEFGERAQGYYGAIWASCSRDERVVLGHLAEEGLVNAKNRRVVRRLMARGLIRRAPNLCLMNETFRRFVASPVCREQVLSLEQAAGRSAWDRFHWPFSVALAACAALILVTQQELLDSTVATVTGVTAGLPTLLKLLDLLGWKRGVKSA